MVVSTSNSILQVAALLLLACRPVYSGPTVTVLNGTYEGYHLPTFKQDAFLGMPYSQPPVGELRFRAPASLNSTWTGTRSAVDYSDVCMQYTSLPGFPMSEDCLSINVIRPSNYSSCKELPVAVWIHGGGLYSGSSAGTNLTNFVSQASAAGKPLIAVSINYRLTAFGFLWGSDELEASGSANNGLRDQRLALHWLQENIGFFGGDATKVTIWGQSSGALSVGKQLIAYGGRDDGLFRAAIMHSGGMAEKWPFNIKDPAAYTKDLYQNLTVTTGCADQPSALECLRGLPVETISAALNVSGTPVFSGTGLGPWLTQVDGDFLQDGPTESLDKKAFVPVPIMYTTTTDEATVFGYAGKIDTDEDFRSFVAAGGPDNATVSVIETLYPDDNALGLPAGFTPSAADNATYGRQWKRSVAFHTDAVETASRRKTVDTWAAAGATAYSARHDLLTLNAFAFIGSTHSSDLNFVFNNVDGANYNATQLQAMSVLMSRTWASFMSDLDPNNHGVLNAPVWPIWNPDNSNGVGSNLVFFTNGTENVGPYVELDDYRIVQTRYLNSIMQSQMYY